MTEPVLAVDDLKTWFLTPRGMVRAVDGVSLRLGRGETLGVVGESGSGKSVLARSVMGLLARNAYRSGAVRFEGVDLGALDRAALRKLWGRDLAMVFQDPGRSLNPVMRIARQLMEPLMLHLGLDRAAAHDRAVDLLRRVGVPEPERRLRAYPHELSGGMRQRVAIAIAIACGPKVLLADEPTTALDVTIQRQVLDLLGSLQAEQAMSMVLITHDLGVVAGRTDRIAVMYGGQVVEAAPTRALFRRVRHPYTAALLASIPRLSDPTGTRLATVAGRPAEIVDPPPGCRFAPRCPRAQARCFAEAPALVSDGDPEHLFRCHFPLGDDEGGHGR